MLEAFQQIIVDMMIESDTPGVAVGVYHRGSIATKGFGITSLKTREPVRENTLFQIASCTKPITATLIMKLVEGGYFTLDQPIGELVPALNGSNLHRLTLRMLLSHHGGLTDGGDLRRDRSLVELVEGELVNQNPFRPGEAPGYSNHHFNLAGYVVEQVMGRPFEQILSEEVLTPLGMKHTTHHPDIATKYSLAKNHYWNQDEELAVFSEQLYNRSNIPSFGLYSSANEMVQFLKMHIEQNQLLTSGYFREMHQPQLTPLNYRSTAYGIGFGVSKDFGRKRLNHLGRMMGYRSMITIFPEHQFGVVILANGSGFDLEQLVEQMIDHVLPDREREMIPRFNRGYQHDLSGYYLGNDIGPVEVKRYGDRYGITLSGERLILKEIDQKRYAALREDGEIETVLTYLPGEFSALICFDGTVSKRAFPEKSVVDLDQYCGRYTHQGSSWIKIEVDGDQLIIIEDRFDMELIPIEKDCYFHNDYGIVQFKRDQLQRIEGLVEGGGWYYQKEIE